ncbi:hypothetical protein AB6A40_008094 [Gnathostoma spinigerum]|uniref:RRM domain-containing protein n=1 Tax=Gnathostoma spinigerum TaxID=75299 RepID=A0ABD6EPC0_9BILA
MFAKDNSHIKNNMGARMESRIYVGNLPSNVRERDLEDLFYKYGKISYIDIKNSRGACFAFVEFDDKRDAEDAVYGHDGYNYDGHRIRVEFTRGAGPRGPGGRPLYGRDDRRESRRGPPPRRSGYRVLVEGLPTSGSWQDLKDHMREAGEVCYADVYKDGTGVVEFTKYDAMKYALRKLDDTKFKSHEGDVTYIRLKEANAQSRSRSRSRSPRPTRGSPRYSPAKSTSRSRSRSASSNRS